MGGIWLFLMMFTSSQTKILTYFNLISWRAFMKVLAPLLMGIFFGIKILIFMNLWVTIMNSGKSCQEGPGIFWSPYPLSAQCHRLLQIRLEGDEAVAMMVVIADQLADLGVKLPHKDYFNVRETEKAFVDLVLNDNGVVVDKFEISTGIYPKEGMAHRRFTAIGRYKGKKPFYSFDMGRAPNDPEKAVDRTFEDVASSQTKRPDLDPTRIMANTVIANLPDRFLQACKRMLTMRTDGKPRRSPSQPEIIGIPLIF